MKWKEFRELPPTERRRRHSKESIFKRALDRWLTEARKEQRLAHYFKKSPGDYLSLLPIVLLAFREADEPGAFKGWLDMRLPNPANPEHTTTAPQVLVTAIKTDPHLLLGFRSEAGAFIPGLLSSMAVDGYSDVLEEILSEENLVGLTLDEVVALSAKRGFMTNNAVVKQRVYEWEK
jgi:hypothetical protein